MNKFYNIPGISKYQITKSGILKHIRLGKLSRYRTTKKGYKYVHLSTDLEVCKFCFIHRLVAKTFIPNPENKPEVNHKDGDKTNNNHWNLEWCTHQENIEHAIKNGWHNNRGINSGKAKLTEFQVLEIRCSDLTQKELGEKYNVNQSVISKVKNNISYKDIR